MSGRLKAIGIVVGAILVGFILVRYFVGRSALTIVYAGGTAKTPRVLATNVDLDRTRNDTRFADNKLEMLVFGPGATEPYNAIAVPGAPQLAGAYGTKVWMQVQQRPFLVDLETAKVVHSIGALEERHVPLSEGFKVSSGHSEFSQGFDPASGALHVQADNGTPFLLRLNGELIPWDEYLEEHPSRKELVCRGGRERLCGTETCMKFEPEKTGGVVLAIGSGKESQQASEKLLSPAFLGNEGCVRGLTDAHHIVINHKSTTGKGRPRDLISAYDTSGKQLWSVSMSQLFGDRNVENPVVGLGDDVVVVGAIVSHWVRGKSVVVATIDADGKVHPPSG